DVTVLDPPEFKDALFFPAAKLLVAVEKDRVLKLAIVGDEETLPDFLRPAEKAGQNAHVKLDPSVTVPQAAPGKDLDFLVPSPPALVPYKGAGFSAQVPKDWPLARSVWTDPKSVESVTIRMV